MEKLERPNPLIVFFVCALNWYAALLFLVPENQALHRASVAVGNDVNFSLAAGFILTVVVFAEIELINSLRALRKEK